MGRRKNKKSMPDNDPVTAYALDVTGHRIITGRLVRLACERHLRDLKEGPNRGLRFDEELAEHAINFFPTFLRHNEGRYAEMPFELSPHQKFITGSLFGWIKADGYRRFRHAYIECAKGEGKSPWGAGALLYGLTMDGEIGAEIYVAAVTRDQAGIAFRDCKNMAEKSIFADKLIITEHNIAYPETNSFIRPVSSEARSLDGKRVFMSLLDEIHEHPTPLVINKIVAGNKGRLQPLNLRITNAGWDRTSVCWYEHEYSREVLERVQVNDEWFAFVCQLDACPKCQAEGKSQPVDECPDCDHWWEEKNWVKACPNLGVSVTAEYVRGEVKAALAMPSKALTVKRLNFCIWSEVSVHWMPLDEWDKCGKPADIAALKGRQCFAGIDLADTTDTASMALCFPPDDPDDGEYTLALYVWIPQEMKNRTEQERQRFRAWIDQGLIEATPGNVIDKSVIERRIAEVQEAYDLKILGCDRWKMQDMANNLCDKYNFVVDEKEAQISNKPLIIGYGQGYGGISEPTKQFLDYVLMGRINHLANPVLRWMAGNAVAVVDDAGNTKLSKGKSTEKIDGIIAGIMALDLAVHRRKDDDAVYIWSV